MATILDELISILGFEVEGKENLDAFKRGLDDASKKSESFGASIAGAAKGAVAGLAAIGVAVKGATAGMFAMANAAAGPLDEIVKASDRAGVAVEAMQELGFVAEQSGSSVGEMTNAVEMMSRRLAEAARGQGRAKTALEDYGLSATDAEGNIKNAADFMGELADVFQDISEAERLDLGRQLGLSRGLITMLAQGNDEIERLRQVARDAGLIFTDEDARNAEAYNDAMNLLTRTVRSMRDRIAIDLLPTLMSMIGGMQDWFTANREVIQQNVGAFLERIARHARTITERGGEMADAMGRWIWVFGAVALAAWPLGRVIAGVAIAFDDFMTWWDDGGESFLGRFSEMLQSWGASSGVADTLTAVAGALALFAVVKPGAFLRMVGGLGRLLLAVGGLKLLGAAGVMTGLGTAIGIFAAAALAASWKIMLVVGAIWALVAAYRALRDVDFTAPTAEFNEGTKSLQDRGRQESERLGKEFDREMEDSLGSRALRFLFGGGNGGDEGATVQPQSFGTTPSETFGGALGPSTDNRDQSTNIDVGGINVHPSPGMDEAGLARMVRDRIISVNAQTPVTP